MDNIGKANDILSVVTEARNLIYTANCCNDKRKKEKQIREAKIKAQEMLLHIEPEVRRLCKLNDNYGMDDLFAWGFLESDIEKVYTMLSDLNTKK